MARTSTTWPTPSSSATCACAALKLGLDAYLRGHGQDFDDMADALQLCYVRVRGNSRLDWNEALPVAMAAWTRLSERHAPRSYEPEPRFGFATIR
jgi:hypothetical protein